MSKVGEIKQSALISVLNFMRKSKVNRFLVGYGTFFGLAALIYWSIVGLIVPVYYQVAPPRSFVDYYYARVADTPVGTDPQLTLCRRINYDNLKVEAVRTFIYLADGKDPEPVGQYDVGFTASKDKSTSNCLTIRLREQPQVAGKYTTSTSVVFYVEGNRKSYTYKSNEYEMIAQKQTDQQKIDELQRQIDEINRSRGVSVAPITQPSSNSGSTPPAAQKNQVATNDTSDSGNSAPASENTSPPPGAEPTQSTVFTFLNGVLNSLGL